jgi:hypothetical protein
MNTPGPLSSTAGQMTFGAVVVVVVDSETDVVVVDFDAVEPGMAVGDELELHATRPTSTMAPNHRRMGV